MIVSFRYMFPGEQTLNSMPDWKQEDCNAKLEHKFVKVNLRELVNGQDPINNAIASEQGKSECVFLCLSFSPQ